MRRRSRSRKRSSSGGRAASRITCWPNNCRSPVVTTRRSRTCVKPSAAAIHVRATCSASSCSTPESCRTRSISSMRSSAPSGRVLVPRWLEPPAQEVVSARAAMARALAMQSRWPQAAEQAQAVLAVAPNNAEARFLLANALFQQQRYEEAGGHYREYLKARPDDVNALINGGVTMIASGRLDDAIGSVSPCRRGRPPQPEAPPGSCPRAPRSRRFRRGGGSGAGRPRSERERSGDARSARPHVGVGPERIRAAAEIVTAKGTQIRVE